ncbi:MAG: LuxR C-terminal-related transcriptional regulator, partial [Candidatus Sericytochromatia bacterium]
EKKNLFLVSLDSNREWFRYHSLFSEILISILKKKYSKHIKMYYQKAYTWLKNNNFYDDAIYCAEIIKEYNLIIEIIHEQSKKLISERNIFKLLYWCEKVPINELIKASVSYLYYLICLVDFNRISEVEKYIDEFENYYNISSLESDILAILYQVKALLSLKKRDIEGIKTNSVKIIENSNNKNYSLLGSAHNYLANYYLMNIDTKSCINHHKIAAEFQYKDSDYYSYANSLISSAYVHLQNAELKEAFNIFNKILDSIDDYNISSTNENLLLIYSSLAWINYYKNNMPQCNKFISKAIEVSEKIGNYSDLRVFYNGILGMYLKLNNFPNFDILINKFKNINLKSFEKDEIFNCLIIRKAIRMKDFSSCELFIDERIYVKELDKFSGLPSNYILALIEALIYTKKYDDAEFFINKSIKEIENLAFIQVLIELLLLKALLFSKKGFSIEAKKYIKEALLYGEPENFIRLFTDSFKEIHPLILNVLSTNLDSSFKYISELKQSFEINDDEFLSIREIEILKLIAKGFSNQQISASLYISINTVKTHIQNIFKKLDVQRRTQAIDKAKTLNL